MKAGTLIKLADGRMGRVVYNGLDGVGIKLGTDPVDVATIMRGDSGLFSSSPHDAELQKWAPEALYLISPLVAGVVIYAILRTVFG